MESDSLRNVHVLLVDDDEEDYIIIKKLFAQIPDSQFHLEWTPSYTKARDLIAAKKHAVYLIDYQLGEHTGLELLETAHPEKRTEPFILLTGAGDKAVELQSMNLAASDYLVKGTLSADSLARTLRYALQRKAIEQQRIEQLMELNRSKDEFISLASHQLRTPATGVKQYIGMLLEGFLGTLDPVQEEILKKAYASNERQLRIVSDLLKVAQVDAGKTMLKKITLNVNELIYDVIEEQKDSYTSREQTVDYQPRSPDVFVTADYGSLRMVLENIVDNASKYSENGSVVQISIDDDDTTLCIRVRDQGVGIDPTAHDRLFEKFSRIDNSLSMSVGGTGLGLYWAKKIIDLHDGKILQKQNEDKGTTFTVCLPKQAEL